jgi:hypothetical protein
MIPGPTPSRSPTSCWQRRSASPLKRVRPSDREYTNKRGLAHPDGRLAGPCAPFAHPSGLGDPLGDGARVEAVRYSHRLALVLATGGTPDLDVSTHWRITATLLPPRRRRRDVLKAPPLNPVTVRYPKGVASGWQAKRAAPLSRPTAARVSSLVGDPECQPSPSVPDLGADVRCAAPTSRTCLQQVVRRLRPDPVTVQNVDAALAIARFSPAVTPWCARGSPRPAMAGVVPAVASAA